MDFAAHYLVDFLIMDSILCEFTVILVCSTLKVFIWEIFSIAEWILDVFVLDRFVITLLLFKIIYAEYTNNK
jgi:hypothetical protein